MIAIDRNDLIQEISSLKKQYGDDRSALIPALHDLQDKYGYLSDIILQETAIAFDIPPADVEGVATFYTFFRTREKQGRYVIRLCQTISCDLVGKERVARQFENELGIEFGDTTKDGMFTLEFTNCMGLCDQGPAVLVNDKLYARVTPEKVSKIIADCKSNFTKTEFPQAVPFQIMKKGPIIDNGVKAGEALKAALAMSQQDIINAIKESKIRGRGGAGFPTGNKWQYALAEKGDTKIIICNADEGEPGTFKDRFLVYEMIDLLAEGMTIAAYAVGANKGFIYLRAEYKYMKKYILDAIERKVKANQLGKNILGKSGFNFDLQLRFGAGAYVCGEETALIESLEGKRGEPRNKPPYPIANGFQGFPTVVNNVETFIDAALICVKGAKWFNQNGSEASTGMKLMSISGDCEKPGIYELPFGITIKDMLKEVGGENAKAVQVGGASGLCIPRKDFGRKIGYEDVATGGSIMVFGPDVDMLGVALNFMDFFVEEACGQCTPCRDGNVKILEGLEMLEHGMCSAAYLDELVKLGETMKISSKCGLGQTSACAFISIVENFKDELLGRVEAE